MKSVSLLCVAALLLSRVRACPTRGSTPTTTTAPSCNQNSCLAAVRTGSRRAHDCRSILQTVVTPAAVTVTTTLSFSVTATVDVPVTVTSVVDEVDTSILYETQTVDVTVDIGLQYLDRRLARASTSFITSAAATTTATTSAAATATATSTATTSPSGFPSACSNLDDYASACSCFGVTAATSTAATPTSTSTVYLTVTPATVSIATTVLTETMTSVDSTLVVTTTVATVSATATVVTVPDFFFIESLSGDTQGQYIAPDDDTLTIVDQRAPDFGLSPTGQLIETSPGLGYYYTPGSPTDQWSLIQQYDPDSIPDDALPLYCDITPSSMLDCTTGNAPYQSIQYCDGNVVIAVPGQGCGDELTLEALAVHQK